MKWIEARHLKSWADRIDARTRLSEILAQLVRASAASITAFRFPTGDSAQLPGYDGILSAIPADSFRKFLPVGDSVWEFGTAADYFVKANGDYKKRTESPGESVNPVETTFVFVTPRVWDRADPSIADWISQKKAEQHWQDVRVVDGVSLENWLELCPAVAASVAREIVGSLPVTGALSADEYWKEYSTQFEPRLKEQVLIAGREEQAKSMLQALSGGGQVHRWQSDSLAEVLAFMIACVRTADTETRKFLETRTLILESKDAARKLVESPHLVFAVRGEAAELAGRLAESHAVILPLGRESLRNSDAIRLNRPTTYEMSAALKLMGFTDEESNRVARECDRSVTILARRIPSAAARQPAWHSDAALIPALLAGAWDCASEADCLAVARLAGEPNYPSFEAKLRPYLLTEDAPLEREGTVWRSVQILDPIENAGPTEFTASAQMRVVSCPDATHP
jgi:hypothetical protein